MTVPRPPHPSKLTRWLVPWITAVFVVLGVLPTPAAQAATCQGRTVTITGTTNGDHLTGTTGDDVIAGLGGNDDIDAGGGNDVICGGSGNDGVNGGAGNDQIAGEDGYDLIVGGTGTDTIDGGLGTDALYGGAGPDQMHGGAQSDYMQGGDNDDALFGDDDDDLLDGNSGSNTIDGGAGTDACQAGASSDCEAAPTPPCAPPFAAEFGVRDPSRFTIQNTCFRASGVITRGPRVESDGDRTFHVSSDAGEELHIEFVPRDAGHFVLPAEGARITLTGVKATDSHGTLEIHPVFQEDYAGSTYFSGPQYAGSPHNSYDTPCWREDGTDCSWGSTGGGTADTTPPTAPRNLIAGSASSTQVSLSWQASTDNVGVAGYEVLRNGVRIGSSTTTSFTDPNVAAGSSYSYTVSAFDDGENSSPQAGPLTVTIPSAGTRILTFLPSDDTYTQSDTPATNYGTATTVVTDNSPVKHLLARFDVTGIGFSAVAAARLRLNCVDGSSFGGDFRSTVDASWSESGVTWNTEPATGSKSLGTLNAVTAGRWYEVDASALVTSDGQYGIKATSTSSDGAHYSSKEGADAPQLVVTVNDSTAPDLSPPSKPGNLTATAASASAVNLAWSASSDDVGVAGYEILRGGTVIGTTTATSYQDTLVQPSTTYSYTVRAFDAAQNRSPESDPASATTPAAATSLTFTPSDDATIRSDRATSSFGSATSLETDGSPIKDFLLKFAVTGVGTRRVTSATLRLRCIDGSPAGGTFRRVADTSWAEKSVTWGTAPPAGATALASLGAVTAGATYDVDVTSSVQGDGVVSLRVSSTSTNGADYSSKEGTAAPQLIVTTSG